MDDTSDNMVFRENDEPDDLNEIQKDSDIESKNNNIEEGKNMINENIKNNKEFKNNLKKVKKEKKNNDIELNIVYIKLIYLILLLNLNI